MQGKGLVRLLLIVLAVVCILQCSYILPTNKVERNAEEYAEKVASQAPEGSDSYVLKKQARINYLDSMSSETVFKIPGLKAFTYDELKKRQLALGLDLKGGQSMVLQVDLKQLLIDLSDGNQDIIHEHGRGLLIVKHLCEDIQFNPRGNQVSVIMDLNN